VRQSACRIGTSSAASADEQSVGAAQGREQVRVRGAQARAEDGKRTAASPLDGVSERLYEADVAAELVCPVIQDADDRAVHSRLTRQDAPVGLRRRLGEPVPGEQDRVAEEPVQLPQVVRAALGEVAVRLRGDAGRDRRAGHQVGIRSLLATERDHRDPAGEQRVDAVLPHPVTAEDAHHDDVHAVNQRRQVLRPDPGRIGQEVVGAAGPRAQQVGVRRRQQQNHSVLPPVGGDGARFAFRHPTLG
jgi:hypothetical protein